MLITPIQSEKTLRLQADRIYMFRVPEDASKQEIAKQIEKQYTVSVLSVRVAVRKGKKTRFSRGKHAYPGTTYRQDKRFAYVTLKDGDSIKIFEEQIGSSDDTKADKKGDK